MISDFEKQQIQADNFHTLPLTPLEEALKTAYLQHTDIHDRILNIDELNSYYTWMASNAAASSTSGLTDISMTDGEIGTLGLYLLQNPKDTVTLTHLTSLYETSAESSHFSIGQDITICRPLRYMPPYWHTNDYFEVYYFFSGPCPVHFENETITAMPGDVMIIPPYTKNAAIFTSDDTVLFDIMIRSSTFRYVFLEQLAPSNIMTLFFTKALSGNSASNYLRFQTGKNTDLEHLLFSIYNTSKEHDPYSLRMRNPLMSTFFLLLLKQYEQIVQLSPRSALYWKPEFAQMLIYIQTNYRTVTLEKISQKFHYSQRQIIRIIRQSTDKTFSEFLMQLRMEKAAMLLKDTDIPVEQIATEIGYSSLSGFYHSFYRYYGVAPGQWRKCNI